MRADNNTGTVTSTFDAVGALEAVSSSFAGSVVSNVDRNAAGAWTTLNYANGVTNSRSFASSTLQLSGLQITGPSGTYLDYSYGYNSGSANNGRIASITDNQDSNKTVSYTYDELNRLATAATSGSAWGLSWTYDRYGNRTAQSVTKGSGVPSNSLTVSTSTNRVSGWTYDSAGNVTNDGRNTYTYDTENRVLSSNNGSATTTYTYDAFGGRVTKTTGSTTTRYYFGLGEYSGSSWKLFVGTAAGVVEYETGTTTITYKSNDYLGSPRVMTNSSGTVAARTDLYPYGEVWSETSGGTKYKMTGKERDTESGNDFFGARYYYNGTGRWLGVDPAFSLRRINFDPQQLNRYVYARNDPIRYIDPDGAFSRVPIEIQEGEWVEYIILPPWEPGQSSLTHPTLQNPPAIKSCSQYITELGLWPDETGMEMAYVLRGENSKDWRNQREYQNGDPIGGQTGPLVDRDTLDRENDQMLNAIATYARGRGETILEVITPGHYGGYEKGKAQVTLDLQTAMWSWPSCTDLIQILQAVKRFHDSGITNGDYNQWRSVKENGKPPRQVEDGEKRIGYTDFLYEKRP